MASSTIVIKAKDKTKGAFASVNKGLGKVRKGVNSTALKVGVLAGVAGFGALIKSSSKTADSLAKTADKIGISTEALAGLQNAAEITGVSQETLNKALVKQQVAISDYSNGIGLAKREFEQLGFAQDELAKMSADEQFFAIADALGKVENSTERVNIAYKIYGGRATDLLNTLDLGRDGLQKFREESELFGTSLSRIDAAKIEMANDEMTRIGQISKGFGLQLTAELAPILGGIANLFVENAKEAGEFNQVAINLIDNLLSGFGHVGDTMRGIQVVVKGLEVVFAGVAVGIIGALAVINAAVRPMINGWILMQNMIAGTTIPLIASLGDTFDKAKERVSLLTDEFDALASKPMPSENFANWAEEVRAHAQTAAEAIAESKEQVGVISLEKTQEQLNEETQMMLFADAMRIQNEQIYNDQQVAMAETAKQQKIDIMGQTFGALATLTASSSQKMFKIGKAASIVSAIINTHQAVTKTMAETPYPWNIPLAIAQGAAGMVQVQSIKSQSFSGARELGGDVMPGHTYRINERGEEFFTPNQAGTVTSAGQAGGASNITFAPVVQAFDPAEAMQNSDKLFNGFYNRFIDRMNEEGHSFA